MEMKILGDGGRGQPKELEQEETTALMTAFEDKNNKVDAVAKIREAEESIEVAKIVEGFNFDPFLEFDEDGEDNGEMVYIMPMLQFPKIEINDDQEFTVDLLEWLSESNSRKEIPSAEEGEESEVVGRADKVNDIHLISGYLNPTNEMVENLSNIKADKISFMGAAPEANSFYNAPFPKYLVPLYYQSMMERLKNSMESVQFPDFEKQVKFFEFFPEADKPFKNKTFHSKGFFVKTSND
jgi:hypothetical protein